MQASRLWAESSRSAVRNPVEAAIVDGKETDLVVLKRHELREMGLESRARFGLLEAVVGTPPVSFYQISVRIFSLRIFVEAFHVGMRWRRVEIGVRARNGK